MGRKGMLHRWVQQNHDGLPQKAGVPQHVMNEIHGAWFDPSNPVVAMSGALRSDLFDDLLLWEQKADLTIALGTSMCGMNADRVFTTVSQKALIERGRSTTSSALGGVIISLQQTQYDDIAGLRIFAKIDDVFALLMKELEISTTDTTIPQKNYSIPETLPGKIKNDMYYIPYDNHGRLLSAEQRKVQKSILDLRVGKKVRITKGPFVGDIGEIIGKNIQGQYDICFQHKKGKMTRKLGSWWVETAIRGEADILPVHNVQ